MSHAENHYWQAFPEWWGHLSNTPLILFHADKNIPAAQIVKIVGKCANCAVDTCRVPPSLEFNPFTFNSLFVQQSFNIYRH
jgi:hypothetical protein